MALLRVPTLSSASRIDGLLPRAKDFATYIGKFCFDFNPDPDIKVGQVSVTTIRESLPHQTPKSIKGELYFLIFDDEGKHWKKMRNLWHNSTCAEKRQDASWTKLVDLKKEQDMNTFMIHIGERLRPRFWYFTFIGCDGLDLTEFPIRYSLHATNDLQGWQQEFSLDHTGLFTTYVVFTVCFAFAGLATWRCAAGSAADRLPVKDHPYVQLLMLAYVASAASCALFLAHYYLFVHSGFGSLRLRFIGVCAGIVANCTMYLLAILASCGWAISRAELPNRQCFLSLVSIIGFLHLLCELHAEMMVDQSTQIYAYSGLGGVFTLMLKVFMFCWFAFQTKSSYKEECVEKRRVFYKILGISISGWSLCVPITVLLAFKIVPWYRYKVVTIVELVSRLLGLCVFSQLFSGPLSPISAENIFVLRDDTEEQGFKHLAS